MHRFRPWWLAIAGYVAITGFFVSPLIDYHHLADASYEGDARLVIWTLAWDAHALFSRLSLFDANMFYPAAHALTWTEHLSGITLFSLPVYALTANPVFAYWAVWLLAFPLNAIAMHALAWRLTRNHASAFVGGVVYAFCFFRMHHGHGHLQLLWTWALPLIPLAIERWLVQPTLRRMLLLLALVLVQSLTSWYLAVFTALLSVITVGALIASQRVTRTHVWQAAVALTIGGAVIGWFARPYFALQTPGISEAFELSADAVAYVVPPENTWVGQWLMAHSAIKPRWIWGEQTLYPGAVTIGLAALGVWALVRRRPVSASPLTHALWITGFVALLLSFGPSPSGYSLFDLLAWLPGLSMLRAPARFALLVMLALATLAAYGARLLFQGEGPRKGVVAAVLVAAFLAESFLVQFPAGKPKPFTTPEVYNRLASMPAGAVLSLPSYRGTPEGFREADYLFYSMVHWHPVANGFGRHEPLPHRDNLAALVQFPAPVAIERLRKLGIRYVVLHTGRASELRAAVATAGERSAVELLGTFGDDYLYQLRPGEP
jgi:hypothetical protein